MEIKTNSEQYLYIHRLLGNLWTNQETYPLAWPYTWIPVSLHSHLKY